jgi:2-oxoglutarate dehydrogenase complex dihydrolipoamide succinyltransferase (E2) component
MKIDMLMPQMGESIAEATIVKWLKNPGDRVEKDEIILEISTDKVDSEIPAPAAGVLAEVLFAANDVVPVKAKIATIDTEGSASAASAPAAKAETAVATPTTPQAAQEDDSSRYYSPLVKGLAEKHGISDSELAQIQGSGQGGRVSKTDLLDFIEKGRAAPAAAAVPTPSSTQVKPATPSPAAKAPSRPTDWDGDGVKIVPMDNMRQAIAEHMVRSKQTSPHVYSVQEVDCSKISKYRAAHKKKFEEREGFGLSFTPFFLEAAIKALLEFPHINSSVDGKKIILKKNINLGCAVALPNNGLIVPVIKHAEEKNFVGIARSLSDLALRARNKKLLPADVSGGTFTVTNPGVFGTMIGTPIINQPQVAILCLGAIKKRAVVVDDMIAIREICYLTLSYDHRIVDGSLGGQFLAYIREYLENWDMDRALY